MIARPLSPYPIGIAICSASVCKIAFLQLNIGVEDWSYARFLRSSQLVANASPAWNPALDARTHSTLGFTAACKNNLPQPASHT